MWNVRVQTFVETPLSEAQVAKVTVTIEELSVEESHIVSLQPGENVVNTDLINVQVFKSYIFNQYLFWLLGKLIQGEICGRAVVFSTVKLWSHCN